MIEAAASKSFAERRAGVPLAPALDESRIGEDSTARRVSPVLWLNLVCLDAPLVAITWQWVFARSFGFDLEHGAALALFLTAWLIYLADRFGDSLTLDPRGSISRRQRFCLRHRTGWLVAVAAVVLSDLLVISTLLDPRAIRTGAVLGVGTVGYLVLNQLRPALWRKLPLKEVTIGIVFAAGTMVGLERELTKSVVPLWLLFATLCALNCVSIAVWERDLDQAQGRVSIATAFPSTRFHFFPALALAGLTSAALACFFPQGRTVSWCIFASAVLLSVLHLRREKIEPDLRTALADLVLLTPLVLWVREHFWSAA